VASLSNSEANVYPNMLILLPGVAAPRCREFATLEASHISNIENEANFTKAAVDFLTAPEAAGAMPSPRLKAPAKKRRRKKCP